ncbi:hypothetical protein JCM6882_001042 [Rhodosporidiobolus microsporus]
MASEHGTFPVLKTPDLHTELLSCECPVTLEDLNHPTPARVQAVYEWWMTRMLGLNAEDVRRAADQQLDQLDHPDIYREAMYIGVFAFALTQLLERCAVNDFTIKDLTAPTAKRFQSILSGILNFYFFEQDQGERVLRPLEDEIEQLANEEEQTVAENAELRERLEKEREERQANERLMRSKQPENDKAVLALNARRAEAGDVKKEADERKAELAALRQRKLDLSQDISRFDLAISELRGQIVTSPEKLQASIKELQYQLNREVDQLRDTEAKERQMTGKVNLLSSYSLELHACIRILDDWQAEVDKLRDAEQQLNAHDSLYGQLQEEVAALTDRIALLNRRIANGREELVRMKDKMDRRRDLAKQRKKTLEETHAEHFETKKTLEMKAAEKNRQAAEVEQQIRIMHSSLQAELEKGEKAYKRIKDQVTLYSIRINKALDSINELNSTTPEV